MVPIKRVAHAFCAQHVASPPRGFTRRRSEKSVISVLLSCKFIAACEDCFQAKVDRLLRRRMLKGMCGEAASNLNIEQGTARSTCRSKAGREVPHLFRAIRLIRG